MNLVTNKPITNVAAFTEDQKKAYVGILDWIKAPYSPNDYKRALSGAAGTGKTYLIKSIINDSCIPYSQIGLSAPTHKATRILAKSIGNKECRIKTIQSDLGLRLNLADENFDVDNPPFDPRGQIHVGEFRLYIVDEASMISKSLVTLLERICVQNQVKLLYCGDAYQLFPVNETKSTAFTNTKTFSLKQIVRQDETNPVKYLLNLLRFDVEHKTYKFLEYISNHKYQTDEGNTKGFYVCNMSEFKNAVINNFRNDEFTNDIDLARIVAYTNNSVTSWNSFVRNNIVKDAEKYVISNHDLLLSYVTIVDDFLSPIITNSDEYIIKDIVNYVNSKYGTPIKGFMVKLQAVYGGEITKPLFIVDHSDIPSVRAYKAIVDAKVNRAKASKKVSDWKDYYAFKNEILIATNIFDSKNNSRVQRDIDYGFAITAHRSQGSTYDTVLVDVNDIVYDSSGNPRADGEIQRRLYVACSRCRNKLYLLYGKSL